MSILLVLLSALPIARAPAGESPRATPGVYVGLFSVGAAAGFNGWTTAANNRLGSWWNLGATAIEGTHFVNSRLGSGLRVGAGSVTWISS